MRQNNTVIFHRPKSKNTPTHKWTEGLETSVQNHYKPAQKWLSRWSIVGVMHIQANSCVCKIPSSNMWSCFRITSKGKQVFYLQKVW